MRTEHHFAQPSGKPVAALVWRQHSANRSFVSFNHDSNPLASSENRKRTTMSSRVATDTFTSRLAMAGERISCYHRRMGPAYNRNDDSLRTPQPGPITNQRLFRGVRQEKRNNSYFCAGSDGIQSVAGPATIFVSSLSLWLAAARQSRAPFLDREPSSRHAIWSDS